MNGSSFRTSTIKKYNSLKFLKYELQFPKLHKYGLQSSNPSIRSSPRSPECNQFTPVSVVTRFLLQLNNFIFYYFCNLVSYQISIEKNKKYTFKIKSSKLFDNNNFDLVFIRIKKLDFSRKIKNFSEEQ